MSQRITPSWRAIRWLGFGPIGLVVAALTWASYLQLTGNFHAVEEGSVYRSAQPSGDQLAATIARYGVRTVINLRGGHPGEAWYDDEAKASSANGATLVDLALSARRELTDRQLADLLRLLRDSPRPILIHCKSGADRTGIAAAIYELVVARRPASEAAAQLSFRYGHFPYFGNATAAMDRSFARVVQEAID